MLHPIDLQQCKQELLERQIIIKQHLKDHFGLEQALNQESTSELSNYDNHPADTGSELFEREKDIALNEHEEKELADIKHALQAIENESYGKCEVCHNDIPGERMMAMPTTTRCMTHAERDIDKQQRPIEEDILHSNIDEQELEGDDHTMFDGEDAWQSVEQYGSSDGPSDFYDTEKDYDNMYYHSKEQVGSVEELEGFLLAGMDGKYIGVNEAHEKYEDYLDENDIKSILYDE
ncbi:transcriptional regulator, TraR/DksA family [Gracilibacillus orientalis]|uniref:Transcriptional regulator, TraR/DksA family n=1 Tax=Gracilibacillus orientalis TaxID=334253 RepID=A0A1I4MF70_9BACI|nr:TraR/DksA C4-type zinc finger protein [Gracilibacillus orientalis]SFM01713.1 transcriptional regulator, TraR/DksA family [Gracilibacillus orientalis]